MKYRLFVVLSWNVTSHMLLKILHSDFRIITRVEMGCYISGIRAGRSVRPVLSNVVYSSVRDKCVKHCRYLLLFWLIGCRSWFEAKWGRSGASRICFSCRMLACCSWRQCKYGLSYVVFRGNMDLRFWLFNKLECLGNKIIVIRRNFESCYVRRYWWTMKLLGMRRV